MKRAIFAIALAALPLFADEIHLKGGGKLTGQITDQNEESVTIDIGAGTMTVKMSTVVNIEKTTSPLQEFRARAATVAPSDIESWRKLGRWATEQGLSAQAHDAYMHVHKALPNDAEANRALGLVLHEGRWVTEEESYEARGFVKFENEWMTPGEREGIQRDRDAQSEATRKAIATEVQASEKARLEREAEEARREEEEKRRNRLPTLGDGFYGAYGWTPTVWDD